jgi:hypothetical protein
MSRDKRSSRPFIKNGSRLRAEERRVTELGFLDALPDGYGSTMGTVHWSMFLVPFYFRESTALTKILPKPLDRVPFLCYYLGG